MVELEKIKRVEETQSIEILNLYLETGWLLIATATPNGDRVQFTVGWMKDEEKDEEVAYPEFVRAWRNKELLETYGEFTSMETAYYYYTYREETI